MPLQCISLLGLVTFVLAAWLLSENRRLFPWRVVLWGLALQVVFAVLILRTGAGRAFFDGAQYLVLKLNRCALEGASMVFGPLASETTLKAGFGPMTGAIFAVVVTATIILVAALSALFYHWGVLQRVVHGVAWVMRRTMGTSGSETLATAANIFMGMTEAPLLIKPYLAGMTRSELMAMMTAGMATLAGGVLAVYADFGRQAGFPAMAGHLVAASVMSAPAALVIAKILVPETGSSETSGGAPLRCERSATNSVDALCRGAADGLQLALNVIAMLIAFVAVVALANGLLGWVSGGLGCRVTLEQILGYLNAPVAWLTGVPASDCLAVGGIMGKRIVLNELLGYLDLTAQKEVLQERSFILTTYVLCGFANLGSIAIQVGGIGGLVPQRREDLARLGFRAMLAGLLACHLTACVVGVLL